MANDTHSVPGPTTRIATGVALVLALVAGLGCEPDAESPLRSRPEEGFLRDIVVIGDSWAAGVQAGALTKRLQLDSTPAILATAFGTTTDPFEALTQPLVANPGYIVYEPFDAFGAIVLTDLTDSTYAAERLAWDDTTLVDPDNRDLMRRTLELEFEIETAFRNLAHPGCMAVDVLAARTTEQSWVAVNGGEGNIFLETVLRPWRTDSQFFGDSLTVLGQARSAISFTPRLALVGLGFAELFHAATVGGGEVPYDAATFGSYLGEIVDSLFVDTDGRVVVYNRPRFDLLWGSIDQLPLDGPQFAALLAHDHAYAAAVADVADSRGVPLVDVRAWYERVREGHLSLGGVDLHLGTLGGVTSLDGFSPTSVTNALLANETIEVINAAFGTSVPPVGVRRYLDQSVLTGLDLFARQPRSEARGIRP